MAGNLASLLDRTLGPASVDHEVVVMVMMMISCWTVLVYMHRLLVVLPACMWEGLTSVDRP